MKLIQLIIILEIFGLNFAFSQTENDRKQIFDLVSNKIGLILYEQPDGYIKKENLFIPDIKQYLKQNGLESFPDTIIIQLAEKFKDSDKTVWTDLDFPKKVIIREKDAILDYKKELTRIGFNDKSEKKQLRKQIENFNNSQTKEIYYVSRPLFNDSVDYAVIQIDSCVNLTGGGAVILFKKINGKWIEFGKFYSWKC